MLDLNSKIQVKWAWANDYLIETTFGNFYYQKSLGCLFPYEGGYEKLLVELGCGSNRPHAWNQGETTLGEFCGNDIEIFSEKKE